MVITVSLSFSFESEFRLSRIQSQDEEIIILYSV